MRNADAGEAPITFGARAPLSEDAAARAEMRRQWGLLHSADLVVVDLRRADVEYDGERADGGIGYAITIESALGRRQSAVARTITGALIAARKSLGYEEQSGRLVLLGRASS